MKKILFYCQYLAGIGHLVRSTEIVRSLVKDFKVCFVNGGQPVPGFEFPPDVDLIHLPAILEEDSQIKAVDNAQSIEELKESRKNQILSVFEQFQPDCIVTECFPFSKHKVKFELLPLLDRAKSTSRPVQVVCSLRDLIMTQSLSAAAWAKKHDMVSNWLNQYYDLVLFHSDAKLQQLDDFFPKVRDLSCEVYYTGYVAQSPPEQVPLSAEDQASLSYNRPIIVASVGGGRFGYELLNAVVEASAVLESVIPHYFYAFAGPFMSDAEFSKLQQASGDRSNLTVRRFTSHLIDYMNKAELSISLGGYNTTMNVLKTKVRSLIFPFAAEEQSGEQSIRAEKLAQKGVVGMLHPDELTIDASQNGAERLAQRILHSLQQNPLAHTFDLQGAEKSSFRLKELLYGSTIAA